MRAATGPREHTLDAAANRTWARLAERPRELGRRRSATQTCNEHAAAREVEGTQSAGFWEAPTKNLAKPVGLSSLQASMPRRCRAAASAKRRQQYVQSQPWSKLTQRARDEKQKRKRPAPWDGEARGEKAGPLDPRGRDGAEKPTSMTNARGRPQRT